MKELVDDNWFDAQRLRVLTRKFAKVGLTSDERIEWLGLCLAKEEAER